MALIARGRARQELTLCNQCPRVPSEYCRQRCRELGCSVRASARSDWINKYDSFRFVVIPGRAEIQTKDKARSNAHVTILA